MENVMATNNNGANAHEISKADAHEFIYIVNQMKLFLKDKIEENDNGFLNMFMGNPMSGHWKAFVDEFEPFELEVECSNSQNTILHY